MPGEGSKNTIRSKRFVTESAVGFYTVTFWTPPQTLVSRIYYRVVRSFPAFHYDVTKMCLGSRIEHQEEEHVDCNYFCCQGFFLSVERTFDDLSSRYYWYYFCFFGNISQQMKEKTNKQTNKQKNKTKNASDKSCLKQTKITQFLFKSASPANLRGLVPLTPCQPHSVTRRYLLSTEWSFRKRLSRTRPEET